MNIVIDRDRLLKLVGSFTELIDISLSVYDNSLAEIMRIKEKHPFCRCIQSTEIRDALCYASDCNALNIARKSKKGYIYRCHAGLIDACFPVIENGTVISYLMFGQILDNSPIKDQWKNTEKLCRWHPDIKILREHFFTLTQLSNQTINACSDIISACTAYVWLSELIKSSEPSHSQRILSYIDANYSSKITLDEMSEALSLCKTTLCCIAKNQLGANINALIRNKRIAMAKTYLETTDMRISEIADKVGIGDNNYFVKIFKAYVGITPSDYQKRFRRTMLPIYLEMKPTERIILDGRDRCELI